MKPSTILQFSLLLVFNVSQAAWAQDASKSAAHPDTHPAFQNFRTINAASRTSSPVRSREEVRSTRQAHGHARLNHTHNRLSTMGLRNPAGAAVSASRATLNARILNMSSVQHIVFTSGREQKKAISDAEKHEGDSHNQTATHTESAHNQETQKQDAESQLAHNQSSVLNLHHDQKNDRREHSRKEAHKERKEKKGFFHRRHKDADGEGNNASASGPNSGNQGIGDGSNVSVNNAANLDDLHTSMHTLTLHEGTAFIAHEKPVCVKINHGEVRIAPHSAVYLVSQGKSVSVYNIADHKLSDVVVITHGKKRIDVKAGEQILLTHKDNSQFEKANPAPEIHSSRMHEMGSDHETKIFHAEFSPLAALDHAEGFHDLVNSKNKADRELADHILKTAAVVLNLRASDQ